MKAIWPGILLLSGSWSFLNPILVPNPAYGLVVLILGCFLIAFDFRSCRTSIIHTKSYLILAPLVICALCVPYPYNLGFWVVCFGLALLVLKPRIPWASGIGIGFMLSGLILILQAGIYPLFFRFGPRLRELPFIADPVCYLVNILGLDCAGSPNTLFVRSTKEVYDITTTLEKMGTYEWLNLSIAVVFIILLLKPTHKGRTLSFVLLAGLGYLVIRYIMLVLIYLNFERMSFFWNSWISVGSFAPLVALFLKFIPLEKASGESSIYVLPLNKPHWKKLITISSGAFIGMFLIVASWGFHDPGKIKKGRIIIDEKHSNWEWTTRKYDTQWFGMKSGYNYYCLADYLRYFYNVAINFKPISTELLRNCDVLIIKTPTAEFSEIEIGAIVKFVRDGGGLFLIGEHTNVFGTSTYINPLSKQFGMKFEYDATYDLKTGDLSVYKPPRLLPHPIVQNLTAFLFGSSCTLDVAWSAEEVIMGYGLKSLKADYSQKNFFNPKTESPSMDFGQFVQSAAVKHGKGRVLAFTDSTVFSNFWIFLPGKPELLLGSINWLNRRNYFPINYNVILLLAGFLFLLASGLYAQSRFKCAEVLLILLFSAILAFPLATIIFSSLNRCNYSPPQPHTKLTRVSFDLGHSDIFLPILELVSKPERSYHTFYVWTQRLGYVPMAVANLKDAVIQGDLVIIINPVKHLTREKKDQLSNYVNQGGKLIIMDNAYNRKSTANEIIQDFGMKLEMKPLNGVLFYDLKGRRISATEQAKKIEGGRPVLLTEKNDALLSYVKQGKGIIAVFADSMLFSDRMMGTTGIVPSSEQLKIYELEFWILKWLIDSNDGHSDIINAPTGSFGQHVGTGPMVKHHPAVIGAPRAVMPGINSLFTK
ncbi:MAG: hypothetical protein GY850_45220 [bacterium]|nr:hypothetical protein [bacterium]